MTNEKEFMPHQHDRDHENYEDSEAIRNFDVGIDTFIDKVLPICTQRDSEEKWDIFEFYCFVAPKFAAVGQVDNEIYEMIPWNSVEDLVTIIKESYKIPEMGYFSYFALGGNDIFKLGIRKGLEKYGFEANPYDGSIGILTEKEPTTPDSRQ